MNAVMTRKDVVKEKLTRSGALAFLLILAGLALAGPYGLLAWSENVSLLDQRHQQIAALKDERDELKNSVALLDPDHVDPDLSTELVRRNLNVAHEDEYILQLDQQR